MIKTLSIRELEAKADNIYEAIIVLAKRARQLNADQKQEMVHERESDEDYDVYIEEEVNTAMDIEYQQLPKPSALALEEYLSGQVTFDYQPDETTENNDK